MKKVIVLFCLSFSFVSFSQSTDFWDDVQFGGGFTLGFGNQTNIGISPSAIYNFNNGFAFGAGLGYMYREIGDFSTNAYNTNLISLYQTNFGIQFSGEFEYYFASQTDSFNTIKTDFPALHLGVAFNQGRFTVGVRYDVLYDSNKSIFASPISPIVRFYF
ncbi:alpha-ketoglutarate decarboxylase [Polaribacter sp. R77954]|uniref:alpha-ketoglutarate decarboxylase n=1 Tax=Polaribacter sp. R77954 TaxID=3093870 RepID=UPI0037C6AA03